MAIWIMNKSKVPSLMLISEDRLVEVIQQISHQHAVTL